MHMTNLGKLVRIMILWVLHTGDHQGARGTTTYGNVTITETWTMGRNWRSIVGVNDIGQSVCMYVCVHASEYFEGVKVF